jgi:hypothetical protein
LKHKRKALGSYVRAESFAYRRPWALAFVTGLFVGSLPFLDPKGYGLDARLIRAAVILVGVTLAMRFLISLAPGAKSDDR